MNDILENPTSEALCEYLRDAVARGLPHSVLLKRIEVSENDASTAHWDLFEQLLFDSRVAPLLGSDYFSSVGKVPAQ
jgi:hypothetical protein